MLKAAIVEHNTVHRETLKKCITDFNMDISVTEFSSVMDFISVYDTDSSQFDILISGTTIDKKGDGIELASYIRSGNTKIMICFATDTVQYYAEAFSVFATGYLIHPIDASELYNCISFYFKDFNTQQRSSWLVKEKGGNYRRIFCRNISYIESNNREVRIYLDDGSYIDSYTKLSNVYSSLEPAQFLRCHQSYIINLYYVDEMEHNFFHIHGTQIPISRKYQRLAKDTYLNYANK